MNFKGCNPQAELSPGVMATVNRVQHALQEVVATEPQTLPDVAQGLADQGLLVTLRSGLGVGIDSPDYLSTLRHSFLICQEGSSGVCIIIDLSFQDQFSVAGMPISSSYVAAVSNVPKCFVGTIGTVNALVCLLVGTLLQESSSLGIELPPWRSKQALISKWLPRRFADTVFTPPSFASLHPALKSSIHGGTLSSSPVSIQSWRSLLREGSVTICSDGQSLASTSRGSSLRSSSTSRGPLTSESHTVIRGFSAPSAGASQPSTATAPCSSAFGASMAERPSPARSCSALTQQLAAASNVSRSVKHNAEAHWQQCLLRLGGAAPPADSVSPSSLTLTRNQTTHRPLDPSAPQQPAQRRKLCGGATDSGGIGSGGSSFGCGGTSRSGGGSVALGALAGPLLHSIVLSPVHRRTSGTAGVRRGTCNGLKLGSETLKMLPRIYTVKLAAAAAC